MNKKEAKEAFNTIRSEYNHIAYPKYLNADLDDLYKKYNMLKEIEEFFRDDFCRYFSKDPYYFFTLHRHIFQEKNRPGIKVDNNHGLSSLRYYFSDHCRRYNFWQVQFQDRRI